MSLFNPFRAHIAATKNQWFCIRKLSITAFGWIYLDKMPKMWRSERYAGCNYGLAEARAVLLEYKTTSKLPDTWYVE